MSKATRRIHKTPHLLARRRRRTSSNDVSSRRQLTLRSAIKTNQPIVSACFASGRERVAPGTTGDRRHSTRFRKDTLNKFKFAAKTTTNPHSFILFSLSLDARTGVVNCRVMSANGGREGVHGVFTPLSRRRRFPFVARFGPSAFGSTFSLSKSANSNWARNDVRSSRVGVYVPRRRPSTPEGPSTLVATSMTRDDRAEGG